MAANITAAATSTSSLILQVETGSSDGIKISRFAVNAVLTSASVSRPSLFRATTKGTGISDIATSLVGKSSVNSKAYATFSVNPSLPSLQLISRDEMSMEWLAAPGQEVITLETGGSTGSAIVLYQSVNTGGGGSASVSGQVFWEEL